MNKLILYAIIIFIIYHLYFILLTPSGFRAYGDGAGKEGYSDEENKLIEQGIQAYKDYEAESDPLKKKQKGEFLTQKYDALLQVNPNIFNNGIPDDIKRRMTI